MGGIPKKRVRWPLVAMSAIRTNHLHPRHPLVAVWWSAAFPGFGHMLMGNHWIGLILFIWEIILNVTGKVNLGILYSFTGRIQLAKDVMDERLLILYVVVFVFGLWDSYRSCVELNKLNLLARRGNARIPAMTMSSVEANYLDKRNPWVAALWSALMPGMGHLYIHDLLKGICYSSWWVVFTYYSRLFEAVHLTLLGQFTAATAIVDPEWLLFMPSLYNFAIFSAYTATVELNKLFEVEQSCFLRLHYQYPEFQLPLDQ